jgi:hypothetical protein
MSHNKKQRQMAKIVGIIALFALILGMVAPLLSQAN